jgi:bifunctional DNA-binding transcriptional regulator/antitoxin component of YhaV-PrlF toxin-antitoxin module
MAIIKVTEKGKLLSPIDLRRKLGIITKDDYLVVESEGEYLKLRKVSDTKALGPRSFVGADWSRFKRQKRCVFTP